MMPERRDKMAYWLDLEAVAFLHVEKNIFSLDLLAVASQDRRPLRGSIQFFVGGDEQNGPVRTDNRGRASKNEIVLEVEPGLKKLLIEAQIVDTDKRVKKFIDVPWPNTNKPKVQVKLELISGITTEQSVTIFLARVDETGKGVMGKVFYIDPTKPAEIQTKDTDENGISAVAIPFGKVKRTAIFFLPEKPNEKIDKEIPSEKRKVAKTEQQKETTPKRPLKERIAEAYKKGRKS
ncbi:MAG: hypothetical protein A2174_01500 [Candidatus Portnoybacteria bacterium RBG_13_41_18]|uniref:Uncharacterized protein n=1 Tax=Candidatus Portnoybacteria bacterium RBG_13_41_18 TaxID=1801991 RepID=A0A1G2F9Z7_9BACT|nr:MAG: hypothetical protein A2174_01500 [Candidatus Portnoybacteria bacterium RBG_13_41_18]